MASKGIIPKIVDSTIHNEFEGSDHCPIALQIDLKGEGRKTKKQLEAEEKNEYYNIYRPKIIGVRSPYVNN